MEEAGSTATCWRVVHGIGVIMQGRKVIRSEWKIFEKHGLDSRDWLVQKATPQYLQIVNRTTGEETKLIINED